MRALLTMAVMLVMLSWVGAVWALVDAVRRRAGGSDEARTWVVFLLVSLLTPLAGLVAGGYLLFSRPRLRATAEKRAIRPGDRVPGWLYGGSCLVGLGTLLVMTVGDPAPSAPPNPRVVARETVSRCLGASEDLGEREYGMTGFGESYVRHLERTTAITVRVIGRDERCRHDLGADTPQSTRLNIYLVDGKIAWASRF